MPLSPNWTVQDYGLLVFLVVGWLVLNGLAVDELLDRLGRTTITQLVWAHPWVGAAVFGLLLVGALGLGVHFYWQFIQRLYR